MISVNALRSANVVLTVLAICSVQVRAAETGLVGHWKLQGDCRDYSGRGNHGVNHGVDLETGQFDGRQAYIDVPASDSLKLGTGDLTICARVYTDEQLDDVVGDVLEIYDPAARRGITFSIHSSAGGFQGHGTDRHVYFGIDNARMSDWQDCGRPNEESNYVSESMTVYKGKLYAATTGGKSEKAWRRVYRYEGGQKWTDCGQVGDGNTQGVGPLIVHNGELYAATWTVDWTRVARGGYDPGRVYRYLGGSQWEDCGQPSDCRTLNCIASYSGKLYVGGGPETWGVFVQYGDKCWEPSAVFSKEGPRRCFPHSMAVFNGKLFCGYPVVYKFDGSQWRFAGQPIANDVNRLQLYCFVAHQGKLCVGSWPEAKVAVYQGDEQWEEIGRVGEDGTEVNGLVVYNGKLYGGSLPRAEVCRYDGGSKWTSLQRFYSPEGWQPGVPYNSSREQVNEWVRLTCLTIYAGRLFASTGSCTSSTDDAPCDVRGKVFSMEAGKCVSYDDDLGAGWKHLVAMRDGGRLKLFVNGELVAESSSFDPAEYDVSNDQPLRIGVGQSDYFAGRIADVRIYNRALTSAEVQQIASHAAAATKVRSASILLGANASRVDRFAAAELKRCLTSGLGWEVTIADEPADGSTDGLTFFVGSLASGITSAAGFPAISADELAALGEDGIYLKGDGSQVALIGKGARGGLFAVYEFLEKYVGYRWPEPGREAVVSSSSSLPEMRFDYAHKPPFAFRGVALHGPCSDEFYYQIIDWLAKNRLNTLQFSCEVYDHLRPRILEAILDRGLTPKIGAHSRQYFYSSSKYFPAHPEHFALVKGERTGSTQLCYSNLASVGEYARNVVEYLKARPEIGIVGLWPSDGYGFCECDRCQAEQTTDVLLRYINNAAERIHAELPDVKVEFLAYIHYTEPPATIKPQPYVVPTYCEYRARSQFHPITDDRAANAVCRRQLEQWVKLSHQATIYSYYADDVIKKFLYQPVPDVVLADLRYYREIGASGNTVLMMNPQSWWAHGPHMYADAKGAWDAEAALDPLTRDYFHALYGPAAEAMRAHQRAARDLFQTTFDHGETGEQILSGFRMAKFDLNHEQLSLAKFEEIVTRMRNCLAAANSATAEPWALDRIEILDQNAQLMHDIYGILNETAGYKADKQDARKRRIHDHMTKLSSNRVIREDDFRCNILNSLLPHVRTVLGDEEAAKYERVAIYPPE